jgi:hypothetical protein
MCPIHIIRKPHVLKLQNDCGHAARYQQRKARENKKNTTHAASLKMLNSCTITTQSRSCRQPHSMNSGNNITEQTGPKTSTDRAPQRHQDDGKKNVSEINKQQK